MIRITVFCGVLILSLTSVSVAVAKEPSPLAGVALPKLATMLQKGDDEVTRLNAAEALALKIPAKALPKGKAIAPPVDASGPAVVALLLQGLQDEASSVRYVCRQALGRSGAVALDGLIAALASPVVDVRSYAADALGDMGGYPDFDALPMDKAVPALRKALRDKNYAVRVSAAMALKKFGRRSAPALPELIKLLKDDEWAVVDAAVQAVAAADPSGVKSVPALVMVLKNQKHDLREFVCNELAAMGQNAKAGIPALITLLDADAESWFAGKGAGDALAKIISIDPRNPPVEDKLVDERPKVIAALAKSVTTQKVPFMTDDRLSSLLNCKCEIGPEVLPALPVVKQRLQEWIYAPMRPWVPRRELLAFLATAGKNDKENTVAFVEELIADEKVDQAKGLKELNDLLKKLEVTK